MIILASKRQPKISIQSKFTKTKLWTYLFSVNSRAAQCKQDFKLAID